MPISKKKITLAHNLVATIAEKYQKSPRRKRNHEFLLELNQQEVKNAIASTGFHSTRAKMAQIFPKQSLLLLASSLGLRYTQIDRKIAIAHGICEFLAN